MQPHFVRQRAGDFRQQTDRRVPVVFDKQLPDAVLGTQREADLQQIKTNDLRQIDEALACPNPRSCCGVAFGLKRSVTAGHAA